MTPKRQRIQAFILKIVSTIDTSGYNARNYEEFFASMDDAAFDHWVQTLKSNRHAKLTLLVPHFKVVISMKDAFAAAKLLGIEILEQLRLWDPVGKRHCLTKEKYYVLRLCVRRLKQYLQDGLSVPDSDKRLNPLTDQVTKPDKGSAVSFPQAQMIAEKGLTITLSELMTVRGGDLEAYAKMKSDIEETGEADSSVMENTRGIKSARTLTSFFHGMHIESNWAGRS
jgi:hypothetical protein